MAEGKIEVYTREELQDQTRVFMRRLCKQWGMSSDDCLLMDFDDMVEWVWNKQQEHSGGGGEEPEKEQKKEQKKERTACGHNRRLREGPSEERRVPPKTRARKRREEEPEAEQDERIDTTDSSVKLILRKLLEIEAEVQEIREEMQSESTELKERIDTVGEIVDKNVSVMIETLEDSRADQYRYGELQMHFYRWSIADGNLTKKRAPDGLDFDEKSQELMDECEGND